MLRPFRFLSALASCAAALCFFVAPAASQVSTDDPVSVSVQVAPLESLRLSDFSLLDPASAPLFVAVSLTNESERTRDLRLEVEVRSQRFGGLAEGRFRFDGFEPFGIRALDNRDFDSISATEAGDALLEFILAQPALPPDEYTFTARVFEGDRLVGIDSDIIITTNDLSPPEPLTPGVPFGEVPPDLSDPLPLFQWQGEGVAFDLSVYLVEPGRASAEDIVGSLPIFQQTRLDGTFLAYPASAEPLRRDSLYAWQVTRQLLTPGGPQALPGPVYWFRYAPPSEPPARIVRVAVEPTETTISADGFAFFEALVYDDTDQQLGLGRPLPPIVWSVSPTSAGEIDAEGRFRASGRDLVAAVTATVFTEDGELSDYATILINPPPPPEPEGDEAKLDAVLNEALQDARLGGFEADSVLILATFEGETLDTEQRDAIRRSGALIDLVEAPWVQIFVPFDRLVDVAQLTFLNTLSMPAPPVTQSVDGAWDASPVRAVPPAVGTYDEAEVAEAVEAREREAEAGIAVVEFGFDLTAARDALGTSFASARSFRRDRRFDANAGHAAHGRASVQALAEALPAEARVHLLAVQTEPELLRAFRYAADTLGVRVISCSVAWLDAYDHYDGSSAFSQRLDAIAGDRVAVVTAAGNFAQSHWEGPYTDTNTDGRHDFGSPGGDLRLRLRSGVSYSILLSWDDWDTPGSDLDLILADADGKPLYRAPGRAYRSANRQATRGETGSDRFAHPTERIEQIAPPLPGVQTYRVLIAGHSVDAAASPHFEVYVYPPPEGATPAPMAASSLASGIATARRSIPIAAPDVAASSHGPTNDARLHPAFAASGVVRVAGQEREGTSFAAPRIAAAFAQIFAQHPDWTVDEAADLLRRVSALSSGTAKDPRLGWGVVDANRLETMLGTR